MRAVPEVSTRLLLPHGIVFLVLLGLSGFVGNVRCEAQRLSQEEVNALRHIGSKLRKQWDFSVDPCSGSGTPPWVDKTSNKHIASNLTCYCNVTTNVCHVTSILLKSQNLSGELPVEFANLTYLTVLDLTRNYLNGTIPAAWASLPLTKLSLLGNRISGRIPDEFGNITTLQSLVLEANQLQGPVPANLGKLINLNRCLLSSNNFSGELPESLGNLKKMSDFRIDGNPISGKIPSFIGNWKQLQRLYMQGNSLKGPFPPIFATLGSVTKLRVSDLKGGDGKFPPLLKMKGMRELVLRNLSITGQLPDYIGDMLKLKVLDLSFNKLSGAIPSSFDGLQNSIDFMYLTNNMLNGTIPVWILSSKKNLDVSYNDFTGSPSPFSCQQGNVNLVSSYSSTDSNSIVTCLRRNLPCSGKPENFNLFINCGGSKVTIGDIEYEDDTSQMGASSYEASDNGNWAYSSTGSFVGNHKAKYIATNASVLNVSNPELYTRARLTPLSLRYYGLCLQKGTYTVNLHFAEIMFTDDQTFSSVGKRIFDVSIQDKKVLQDFDIAKEANGTSKEIIKTFPADVDGTLEIHFYWAGKGTNSIPQRGVYGPLISAISVIPNFKSDTCESKLSVGAILGIIAASCVVILAISILLWFFFVRKNAENNELRGLELQTASLLQSVTD